MAKEEIIKDYKKVRKRWFFKEPLTEWFFVESKMVLLWHRCEEPFKSVSGICNSFYFWNVMKTRYSTWKMKDGAWFKGAVCRILTLLKHKNTIICLQTFRKHVKLTYLFIWKTMLQSVILLWKCASGPECLCLLWFVKPAHCQFTQLYFGTPGCQLPENTAYLI